MLLADKTPERNRCTAVATVQQYKPMVRRHHRNALDTSTACKKRSGIQLHGTLAFTHLSGNESMPWSWFRFAPFCSRKLLLLIFVTSTSHRYTAAPEDPISLRRCLDCIMQLLPTVANGISSKTPHSSCKRASPPVTNKFVFPNSH